jgi:cellulose synthase/poly-beta-1,6-N-acetylglucosamine synthase-like glycosyltransferase
MALLFSLLGLITVLYMGLIATYAVGWYRQKEFSFSLPDVNSLPDVDALCPTAGMPDAAPLVSVVVAFRNEADNLPALLVALQQQTYKNMEVLVVNDHSTDASVQIIETFNDARFRVIHAQACGKKSAIKQAVLQAKGALILTTDADVMLPPTWVHSMVTAFYSQPTQLLIGPVSMQQGPWWQQLEYASLEGTTVGSAAVGCPVLCSGANLAFTPDWYKKCAPYLKPQIASGDDMFLLEATLCLKGAVRALKCVAATVGIKGESCFSQFMRQRARWAGKAPRYSQPTILFSGAVVALMQVVLVATLAMAPFYPFLLCLFLCKFVVDACLVGQVMAYRKKASYLLGFPLLSLLYPFYVMGVGLLTLFPVSWKNRNVSF